MFAELARFSLGRVFLHLIAMLRDGAIRFHAAGITRELSWVEDSAELIALLRTRLVDALAPYPSQQAGTPIRQPSPIRYLSPQCSSVAMCLLTEGNTSMASLVRRVTRCKSLNPRDGGNGRASKPPMPQEQQCRCPLTRKARAVT